MEFYKRVRGIFSAVGEYWRRIPGALQQFMGSLRDRGDVLRRGAPEQVMRLGVVAVVGLFGALSVRAWVIPTRFKDVELHRKLTLERELVRPVKYAGAPACAECHEEQVEEKRIGHHRTVACESCHGPCYDHSQDPGGDAPTPYAPRMRDYCVLCHAYDHSRPTGFPQIVPAAHNPLKPCIECHKPHAPAPTETPKECSACHGEIERTKAISSHATLSCTECHQTGDAHKLDPRGNRPTKPERREFCGKCHAKGADHKLAPKLDVVTHGEKYLCWECHYPHMPEAR